MYFKQKTIRNIVSFEGIGVHNGSYARITLKPAPSNTGIVITSLDHEGYSWRVGTVIPENAMYATVLRNGAVKVSTIEHVMAAIGMLNIDNIVIEVEGSEFPILDGSSSPFVEEIVKVGLCDQNEQKIFLTPKSALYFSDESSQRSLELLPALENKKELYIEYDARFDNPLAGPSIMCCSISEHYFINELAPARTFGFLHQLPFMQKHGLAKGASLDNTVVIGDDSVLTPQRFENECVRHKVLDLLGDLTLLGQRLIGTVKAKKTGHAFNRLVVEHFINNPHAWLFV